MHSKIIATGSHLPERVVPNDELAQKMTTTDAWIQEKIGIKTRHYASTGQTVSELAAHAAQNALHQAGLEASDLDAILFATSTPEHKAPGSGVLLQNLLGCSNIPAFDVRNTSPGFLFALDLADGLIRSQRYKTVLVVGSEIHSRHLDFSDDGRLMSVIFGDGAGCMILQGTSEDVGLHDFVLHSDGQYADKLGWYDAAPTMDGRHVFANAVEDMSQACIELLVRNRLNVSDIDLVIGHQANSNILKALSGKLNLTPEQMPHNIERVGNTSSASIPILFDELWREQKIKPGQKLLFTSFGSGYSWGSCFITT